MYFAMNEDTNTIQYQFEGNVLWVHWKCVHISQICAVCMGLFVNEACRTYIFLYLRL